MFLAWVSETWPQTWNESRLLAGLQVVTFGADEIRFVDMTLSRADVYGTGKARNTSSTASLIRSVAND